MQRPLLQVLLALVIASWLSDLAGAQKPQGPPYSLAQALGWVKSEKMLKELDILPSQQEKIEKLRNDLERKTNEVNRQINASGITGEDREFLRWEAQAKVNDALARQLEDVLLPHQLRRLKQISLQRRMEQYMYSSKIAAALSSDDLAQELRITDRQKEELSTKEKEIQAEMRKKAKEIFLELHDEARETLFKVLTPDQRQKLKQMMGEKFVWE